jgi:hypothetical protein
MNWFGAHWKDLLEVASTVGTVMAAALAVVAIRNGNKQAKTSADALVRERRLDFELDQLTGMTSALAELAQNFESAVARITIANGLRLLPEEELANVRAYMGAPTTHAAEVLAARLNERAVLMVRNVTKEAVDESGHLYGDLLIGELDTAIRRRLAAR